MSQPQHRQQPEQSEPPHHSLPALPPLSEDDALMMETLHRLLAQLKVIEQDILELWFILCHRSPHYRPHPHPSQPPNVSNFTQITQETYLMVPLAAGQTATFTTTPLPTDSAPVAASIIWTSSDTTNAPVSPNLADTTGLSTLVVFPSTVVAGVSFSLTVSYTNSDGSVATQSNSFTTVAAASPDVTGFTDILQTA